MAPFGFDVGKGSTHVIYTEAGFKETCKCGRLIYSGLDHSSAGHRWVHYDNKGVCEGEFHIAQVFMVQTKPELIRDTVINWANTHFHPVLIPARYLELLAQESSLPEWETKVAKVSSPQKVDDLEMRDLEGQISGKLLNSAMADLDAATSDQEKFLQALATIEKFSKVAETNHWIWDDRKQVWVSKGPRG